MLATISSNHRASDAKSGCEHLKKELSEYSESGCGPNDDCSRSNGSTRTTTKTIKARSAEIMEAL